MKKYDKYKVIETPYYYDCPKQKAPVTNEYKDAMNLIKVNLSVRCCKIVKTARHCQDKIQQRVCTTKADIHNFFSGLSMTIAYNPTRKEDSRRDEVKARKRIYKQLGIA